MIFPKWTEHFPIKGVLKICRAKLPPTDDISREMREKLIRKSLRTMEENSETKMRVLERFPNLFTVSPQDVENFLGISRSERLRYENEGKLVVACRVTSRAMGFSIEIPLYNIESVLAARKKLRFWRAAHEKEVSARRKAAAKNRSAVSAEKRTEQAAVRKEFLKNPMFAFAYWTAVAKNLRLGFLDKDMRKRSFGLLVMSECGNVKLARNGNLVLTVADGEKSVRLSGTKEMSGLPHEVIENLPQTENDKALWLKGFPCDASLFGRQAVKNNFLKCKAAAEEAFGEKLNAGIKAWRKEEDRREKLRKDAIRREAAERIAEMAAACANLQPKEGVAMRLAYWTRMLNHHAKTYQRDYSEKHAGKPKKNPFYEMKNRAIAILAKTPFSKLSFYRPSEPDKFEDWPIETVITDYYSLYYLEIVSSDFRFSFHTPYPIGKRFLETDTKKLPKVEHHEEAGIFRFGRPLTAEEEIGYPADLVTKEFEEAIAAAEKMFSR